MKKIKQICALGLMMAVLAAYILPGTAEEASAKNISGVAYTDMAVDPTVRGSGYSSVLYDNQSGLPTSEANAIAETEEGFIWIGSYSGLIRYDGNTFERMDSTTGITSVVCLYVDSKNRLWIGTNDNGVAVMENGKYKIYDTADGLGSSSVRCITEDSNGTIYIASTNGLNTVTEDMVLHKFDEKQINNKYICELRITDQDVIYGETMDGDIFTIENGTLTSFYGSRSLGVGDVNCVLPDPDNPGYVYIGNTESQIYYGMLSGSLHDVKRMSIYPLAYAASIEKYNGKVWVCADNGIGVFDDDGFHILEDIPLNNSIEHMMVDYEGNLWFTSSRQGIMKIVPNQFTDIYDKYGLENAVVNSTCEYNDMLFIGTDTGLTVIDKNKVIDEVVIQYKDTNDRFRFNHNLISLLQGCRIRSIKRDSKNRLWIATYSTRGLLIYDNGMITRFDNENGLPSNKVRTVYEMSDGTVMVACSGGIVRIRDDKVAGSYDNRSGINNLDVLTVTEGFNDETIIGSDGNGIYIIKGQNIINLGKKDGLHSEVVMRLKRDKERKVIWIITSNSIAYMTEDYKITTIAGFPYSNNFDMYENSQGQMWILSSNGIYVISADDLIDNVEVNPVFFSMDNGLPCVATANSYSCVDADGILYIAGTTGVAAVNIEEVSLDIGNIKINVPYIEADGEMVYPDSRGVFTIPSSTNRLVIYGYVYTYALINPKITYWLDGFDKNFITKSRKDMEPVVYTNLEGGTYHFMMVVQDTLGRDSKQVDVTIVKTKAFYEEAWFRLFVVLAAIGLVFGSIVFIVYRKTRALTKKNEQNRQFINEMTQAFAKTIDMKDKYTNGHSERVAEYTVMLTKELGYDDETVEKYRNIALLHDIGKISIPPEVLNKEGKLTDQEFNIIKSHSAQGYKVLKDISLMPELAIGAGQHHERPDGKGYPKGLKGDEIERVAQIIAVADTFDAMYSDRPYRKRMNFDKAVSIIKEVAGTQLTEDVVEAFLRLVERGGLRAEDDQGGGSMEDIDNIHKQQEKKAAKRS
ncbi:MAG: HD domain-containing protein [Lachnospiraceae bacterium]|nr:HD domain-containing protein [Lachnospiraceae bacterium]